MERRWTLERLKNLAEIVALVCAGLWALTAFGLKVRDERLEGQGLRRATIQLDSTAVGISPTKALLLSRLRIKNPSKRIVRTFLISWWWARPAFQGETPGMHRSSIRNDASVYELAPNEETEVSYLAEIPRAAAAVTVNVDVMFDPDEDRRACRVSPTVVVPDGGVAAMTDQPEVCEAATRTALCDKDACPSQNAVSLVSVPTLEDPARRSP